MINDNLSNQHVLSGCCLIEVCSATKKSETIAVLSEKDVAVETAKRLAENGERDNKLFIVVDLKDFSLNTITYMEIPF